jgi:uncharacterized damage-inducible protein DinB
MARYNAWQNANIYDAAGRLTDEDRKADRGAFFGSIQATLNHILWADQMWLMRFGAAPKPAAQSIAEGLAAYPDWDGLVAARRDLDCIIQDWADGLDASALEGEMTWFSAATGRELTKPKAFLAMHLFNHQTHHRGQVHALLTGFGVKPGVTDLPFGPDLYAG